MFTTNMRKILSLSFVILLGVAASAAAQNKPLIVVVNDLDNPYWISISNEKFGQLADEAIALGFDIEERGFDSFTSGNLSGISILLMAMPANVLSDSDKAALNTYIQNGGALFLLVDSNDYYPWINFSNLDSFISPFGISIGAEDGGDRDGTVSATSPFRNPNTAANIRSYEGRVKLNVDTANAMADATLTNAAIFVAHSISILQLGKGRLVVAGESRWLTDDPGVGQIRKVDNTKFFQNIILWLSGKGVDLQAKTSRLAGPVAMGGVKMKIKSKVRNLGTLASPATTVRFVLASNGNGTPIYEGTLLTLNLESLAPGATKKFNQQVKLPNNLPAGSYILTTFVDPAFSTGDVNLANNLKNSKNITVQ